MNTETTTNDLEVTTEDNPLHELQQAIAAMPEADPAKVAAALKKLQTGQLEILGDQDQVLSCAERIAKLILDESQGS